MASPADSFWITNQRPVRISPAASFAWFALVALLLMGCNGSRRPASGESVAAVDRVVRETAKGSTQILRKTFPVQDYAKFDFLVPPHSIHPHLHGSFRSFATRSSGATVSDDSANVDFLLLNEDELDSFTHGGHGDATYAGDPSHEQTIDFALRPTMDQAQKYYLVFRSSPGAVKTKLVDADFTVTFE